MPHEELDDEALALLHRDIAVKICKALSGVAAEVNDQTDMLFGLFTSCSLLAIFSSDLDDRQKETLRDSECLANITSEIATVVREYIYEFRDQDIRRN